MLPLHTLRLVEPKGDTLPECGDIVARQSNTTQKRRSEGEAQNINTSHKKITMFIYQKEHNIATLYII